MKKIKAVQRSFEEHIETYLKRYTMYWGPNPRIACLNHLLFHSGTGVTFLSDGSIIDVYDKLDKDWEKDEYDSKFPKWVKEKKEWQAEYKKAKSSSLYKNLPEYKEAKDEDYNLYKDYFKKFDVYAYKYSWLHKPENQTPEFKKRWHLLMPADVISFACLSHKSPNTPINCYPANTQKDILNGFIEVLDYMIETQQFLPWANKKKKEITALL